MSFEFATYQKKLANYFLLFLLLLASCGSEKKTAELEIKKDSIVCIMPPPLNPNGESELALLMREMASTSENIKASIQNNSELPAYPDGFGRIYFAKKTDSTLNKELFNGLAQNYLSTIKYFYETKNKAEKIERYNATINSCVGCHSNFCGGPIKRIKKLLIP